MNWGRVVLDVASKVESKYVQHNPFIVGTKRETAWQHW